MQINNSLSLNSIVQNINSLNKKEQKNSIFKKISKIFKSKEKLKSVRSKALNDQRSINSFIDNLGNNLKNLAIYDEAIGDDLYNLTKGLINISRMQITAYQNPTNEIFLVDELAREYGLYDSCYNISAKINAKVDLIDTKKERSIDALSLEKLKKDLKDFAADLSTFCNNLIKQNDSPSLNSGNVVKSDLKNRKVNLLKASSTSAKSNLSSSQATSIPGKQSLKITEFTNDKGESIIRI